MQLWKNKSGESSITERLSSGFGGSSTHAISRPPARCSAAILCANERIRGRENCVAGNQNFPGTWSISIRRSIAEGDQVASEVVLTNGEEVVQAVSFFELRDEKIVRQVDYWPEPYPAPAARAVGRANVTAT